MIPDELVPKVTPLERGDVIVLTDPGGWLGADTAGLAADNHTYSVTVPKGDLWVLGDNRYQSADSADSYSRKDVPDPFVPISDVVGRAVVITWPASRWASLSNYPSVFTGTDPHH